MHDLLLVVLEMNPRRAGSSYRLGESSANPAAGALAGDLTDERSVRFTAWLLQFGAAYSRARPEATDRVDREERESRRASRFERTIPNLLIVELTISRSSLSCCRSLSVMPIMKNPGVAGRSRSPSSRC
jgi:hypothetical protein